MARPDKAATIFELNHGAWQLRKALAGGAVLLMLIIRHVNAGEITCPTVTDIYRNIEAMEDIFLVDTPEDREWKSESLVDVVDPLKLQFDGAEYVIHEADSDRREPTATVTCRYGDINLKSEYPRILQPGFSRWTENRCESPNTKMCMLMSADYFNVSF
ncbi:DUF3757 domain-containing protein [Pseudomonas sp. Q12-87]|uniref:DUF3757 domain-containing protein n=1 Tax=Pseudomonas sp. Q12-87 TaxID=177989 RepID=UPI000B11CB0E|nr:DUF3757 domain-containing protein [Pseudomonas sp. Q12-87]